MKNNSFGKKILGFIGNNSVPILFVLICVVCIPISGFSASYLINEIVTRMGRNIFLILCLLIPIMAGMGLNFGMTLGAMAAELALILVSDWQIWGIPGIVLAMILSIPFSILLGTFCGKILNMAKGREMITSYIISFFMNGIYQLIVLYMMGPIIPIKHANVKLPRGYGIRNSVDLIHMRQYLDNLLAVRIGGVKIPVLTFLIIGVLCLFIIWFRRTKLGQDMRAVGQDMNVARDAGINVERTRIISIVMSTVLAGFGMVIYLQNMLALADRYVLHRGPAGRRRLGRPRLHRQRLPRCHSVPHDVHRGPQSRRGDHRRLDDRRILPCLHLLWCYHAVTDSV